MSSRLFQEVREKRGLVYSVGSYNLTYSDYGTFNLYAGTDGKKTNEVITIIAEEFIKISKGIENQELQRVKERIKTALMASKEMSSHKASDLASDYAIYNKHFTAAEILEKINKITKDDILEYAKKLRSNSNISISAIGKVSDILPYEKVKQLFC